MQIPSHYRNIPVYLPRTKTTILVPKVMSKLVFEFNYKGLTTTKTEIENDVAMIELKNFEEFRRCLQRWQLKENDATKALWEFLQQHVSIELCLQNLEDGATQQQLTQPYIPLLRLQTSKVDQFCELFYHAKFR